MPAPLMLATRPDHLRSKLQEGYVPIALASVVPESISGMRLYLKDSPQSKVRLYRSEETQFREADRRRLIVNGHAQVYIEKASQERFQSWLSEHIREIVANENLAPAQRFSALSHVTREALASAFRTVKLDETLSQVNELAEHCVELFSRDDYVAGDLLSVLCHDYHTFTHSANVAFYCALLAKALGIRDEQQLHRIAVGGFLHDIGKLGIPAHILNKPDRLTTEEYDRIKDHPRFGFQKLCEIEELSRGQLMMVYQHHERIDGRGYPVGCTGDEIHEWSRICSVVDVFEALTSNRPYRKGYRLEDAIGILWKYSGTAFDAEFLKCWISAIKPT